MLGKEQFKVESNVNLSSDNYKSLVLFYAPLIGYNALYLFEYLAIKSDSIRCFKPISYLLNSLMISIEQLENMITKLNEYKLLRTLNKDDEYIFILNNPLSLKEFNKNDIFVREFILKTSGDYYQNIISDLREEPFYKDYKDISKKLDLNELKSWNKNNEYFLNKKTINKEYNFNTFFDMNRFLEDVSVNLLPMRFRTENNLNEIAIYADIYNIDYEQMRKFIPRIATSSSDTINFKLLKQLCEKASPTYKTINDGVYDVPCDLFLMNKQDGKEVTKIDHDLMFDLVTKLSLPPSVVNVIIEFTLNSCNNSLPKNFVNSIASDFHRNNIKTADEALNRINTFGSFTRTNKTRKEAVPSYSSKTNKQLDQSTLDEIISKR